jgi:hypothetical protein
MVTLFQLNICLGVDRNIERFEQNSKVDKAVES